MGSFELHRTENVSSLRMKMIRFHLWGARAGVGHIPVKGKSQS